MDLNPLAVELARVGTWIHTFVPGLPLYFLDHNLRVGNSLTGIGTIEEAIDTLVTSGKYGTPSLFDDPLREALHKADEPLRRLARITDATTADIRQAREAAIEAKKAVAPVAGLFDRLVAARIGEAELPTLLSMDQLLELDADRTLEAGRAREIAEGVHALHFPVAFPEVFLRERPGFDALVGNPPWEEAMVAKRTFWVLRFPGIQGLSPQAKQMQEIRRLEGERPDLVAEYRRDVGNAEFLRRLLLSGPYPGMGTGDPDLYKAFSWRFWNLVRKDGASGVVLPRSAFLGTGSAPWRKDVLDKGRFEDVTMLLNSRQWVFPDVHPQYTVGLVTLSKGADHAGSLLLRGPYPSRSRYDKGLGETPTEFSAEAFRSWTKTASFPLLPSPEALDVFAKLRAHPRLDEDSDWRARPVREFDATNDKKHMIFESDRPSGAWPVYKGASFELWNPDTGEYYAWADPNYITDVLQIKRLNQKRNPSSAFSEFSVEWARDRDTLPCLRPRIAFRNVTRATDTRSMRAALVPGQCSRRAGAGGNMLYGGKGQRAHLSLSGRNEEESVEGARPQPGVDPRDAPQALRPRVGHSHERR